MASHERFSRQRGIISSEDQLRLARAHAAIVGCGGLGGYIAENLARVGVGAITLVDGDRFEESNLNRQLFSTVGNLGQYKATAGAMRIAAISPDIQLTVVNEVLNAQNAQQLLSHCSIIIDAVDSIPVRYLLQSAADQLKVPLVHGAIAGWCGQVTSIFPGDIGFRRVYPFPEEPGEELHLGNPSFTPTVIAGIQSSEVVKILLGTPGILRDKLLHVDLLNHTYELLSLSIPS